MDLPCPTKFAAKNSFLAMDVLFFSLSWRSRAQEWLMKSDPSGSPAHCASPKFSRTGHAMHLLSIKDSAVMKVMNGSIILS